MFSPTILNLILALQVLTTFGVTVKALPITSKPIEGTAEHLAWQAWLMLPPEQKSLEKSRKVTPKSIFTLPFRECPQGHQLFENRCIPTVNIDTTQLLTQQLLETLGDVNNNYDFDYEDGGDGDGDEEIVGVLYDTAQRLSGSDGNNNDTYNYDQPPSKDEPLKFNIFQQKFPTDYEVDSMPIDETEDVQSTAKSSNNTIIATAVNTLLVQKSSVNATQIKNTTAAVDLQMESTNISMNIVPPEVSAERYNSHDIVTPTTAFSISDIDAIALPAVPTQDDDLESDKQNVQKFSLFKDDSSVHLITSTLLNEHNNENNIKQPDLSLLLKADDLLPLPNIAAGLSDSAVTLTTTIRTRTMPPFVADKEVSTLSTSFTSNSTPLSSNGDDNIVSDMLLSKAESTMPTLITDLIENSEKVKQSEEVGENKKEEHPRSVASQNGNTDLTAPQEETFTTTTEPDTTTNFQLDETTVDEVHDAPTIALKELLELAQHPSDQVRENLGVVKKSKVEPVELPPIVEPYDLETEQSIIPTTIPTTTIPTASTTITTKALKVSAPSTQSATTAETPSPATTDRFDYQQSSISSENYPEILPADHNSTVEQEQNANDEQQHDKSNLRNIEKTKTIKITRKTTTSTEKPVTTTPTTTTTTTKTSEIDIVQELHMINELVKGNKHQQHYKGGVLKSTTTLAALPTTTTTIITVPTSESGFTTVDEKSTTASVSSNKDKIIGSTEQLTSNIEEESRTTIQTTPIAITTPQTTTTTKTTTTTFTPTIVEPTATIWSKIMPLFGFSASIEETTVKTPQEVENSEMPTTTTVANTSPTNIESSINSNRSNRNSKIIRINNLSTPSFNSHSSTQSGNTGNTITANKLITSSTQSTLTATTTTSRDTEFSDSDNDSTNTSSSSSSSNNVDTDNSSTPRTTDETEPFWWLPIGWRLDRSNDDEPSLLFRFWSTFPGNGLSNDHRE